MIFQTWLGSFKNKDYIINSFGTQVLGKIEGKRQRDWSPKHCRSVPSQSIDRTYCDYRAVISQT